MAMRRGKINAKTVLKAAKSTLIEKRNITFRIEAKLLDTFIAAVEQEGVSANMIVETLIREFVASL